MRHHVFVYGTLKRGFNNHGALGVNYRPPQGKFVAEAVTTDPFAMLDCGFPVLARGHDPMAFVHGEIYQVTDEILGRLDQLEGNGRMYERERVVVQTDTGEHVVVWVYIGMPDWVERRELMPCDESMRDALGHWNWRSRYGVAPDDDNEEDAA